MKEINSNDTNCVFCTLLDSYYLDKFLVLYDSMVKNIKEFELYVFSFDDICYKVLKNEKLSNTVVISLNEFENEELKKVKKIEHLLNIVGHALHGRLSMFSKNLIRRFAHI